MQQMSMRFHSREEDSDSKKSMSSQYEKSFEDLLGKAKASEDEKKQRDQKIKSKLEMQEEERKLHEENKEKFDQ